MNKNYFYLFAICTGLSLSGQVAEPDPVFIQNLYQKALGDQQGYFWLSDLCKEVGPRLAGSPGDAKAVKWAFETLDTLGYEKVLKQEVDVRHWVRGVETAEFSSKGIRTKLNITALGGSISTPGGDSGNGITAQVVEIKNRKDLYAKGADLKGKVVFFNEPMDPWLINTGSAYGKAGWQRWGGASEAAKYGAVAVLVRSLTHLSLIHI